jgi:hypothetical protein
MVGHSPMKLWVHIADEVGDPWVLQIWGAARSAIKAGKVKELTRRMRELGPHISTRLSLVSRAIVRFNCGAEAVVAAVEARPDGHDYSANSEAYAFRIDRDIKLNLLLDADSLLFELASLCELWNEFFGCVHKHAGKPLPAKTVNDSIRQVIADEGGDSSWINALTDARNYFSHTGAPYLAVDVSHKKYDLLFLKGNVKDLSESTAFVRLSELASIVQGFRAAKPLIRDHLAEVYRGL